MPEFRFLSKSDTSYIAQLHIKAIPTGFISSLGQEFVAALYEAIAKDGNQKRL